MRPGARNLSPVCLENAVGRRLAPFQASADCVSHIPPAPTTDLISFICLSPALPGQRAPDVVRRRRQSTLCRSRPPIDTVAGPAPQSTLCRSHVRSPPNARPNHELQKQENKTSSPGLWAVWRSRAPRRRKGRPSDRATSPSGCGQAARRGSPNTHHAHRAACPRRRWAVGAAHAQTSQTSEAQQALPRLSTGAGSHGTVHSPAWHWQ